MAEGNHDRVASENTASKEAMNSAGKDIVSTAPESPPDTGEGMGGAGYGPGAAVDLYTGSMVFGEKGGSPTDTDRWLLAEDGGGGGDGKDSAGRPCPACCKRQLCVDKCYSIMIGIALVLLVIFIICCVSATPKLRAHYYTTAFLPVNCTTDEVVYYGQWETCDCSRGRSQYPCVQLLVQHDGQPGPEGGLRESIKGESTTSTGTYDSYNATTASYNQSLIGVDVGDNMTVNGTVSTDINGSDISSSSAASTTSISITTTTITTPVASNAATHTITTPNSPSNSTNTNSTFTSEVSSSNDTTGNISNTNRNNGSVPDSIQTGGIQNSRRSHLLRANDEDLLANSKCSYKPSCDCDKEVNRAKVIAYLNMYRDPGISFTCLYNPGNESEVIQDRRQDVRLQWVKIFLPLLAFLLCLVIFFLVWLLRRNGFWEVAEEGKVQSIDTQK